MTVQLHCEAVTASIKGSWDGGVVEPKETVSKQMMSGYAREPPGRDSLVALLTLTISIGVSTEFPASQMGLFRILHRLIVNPHPWIHGNSIPDHIEYRNHYGDDVPAYVQGDHRWLALPSRDHPKTDYDHDLPVEVIEQRRAAIASLKHGKTDVRDDPASTYLD